MTHIVEHFTPRVSPRIENGKKHFYLEGVFAKANINNRNGRIYERPVLEAAISRYVHERVETGRALGSLDHPNSSSVSLQNACIRILDLHFEGDDVVGTAIVLDTDTGKELQAILEAGGTVGMSTRGRGLVNKEGIVGPDYQILAVDVVSDPSIGEPVSALYESEGAAPVTHAGEPTAGLDANPGKKKRRRSPALDDIARRLNANHGTAKGPAVTTQPTLKGHDKMKGETPASNTVRGHDRSGGYKRYKADPTHGGAVVVEDASGNVLDEIPDDVFDDFVAKNAELLREAWESYVTEAGLGTASPPGYGKPAGLHQGEWKKPSKGAAFQKPKFTAPPKGPIGNHPLNEACRHLAECDASHPMFGQALKLAHKLHEASSTPSTYGGQKTSAKPQHDLAAYGRSMRMAASHLKSSPDKGWYGAFKALGGMVSKAKKDAMKVTKESVNDDESSLPDIKRERMKEYIDFYMERFDDLSKFSSKG